MVNSIHSKQTLTDGIHSIVAYSYPNQTARLSAGSFTANDLYKISIQTDNNTLWILTSYSPAIWTAVNVGGGGSGSQNLHSVLALGNTTDGYDLFITSGDSITTTDGYLHIKNSNLTVDGYVNVNNHKIINVSTPTNAQDAVNKSYVDGYGIITSAQHSTLRQLIHLANNGPFEGFTTNAYREITGGVLPTSIIWYENNTKAKKIVSKDLTYNGALTQTITWKAYATDGSTVLATVVDTLTYSGALETSRNRSIS